jgi:glutathione S-transferase
MLTEDLKMLKLHGSAISNFYCIAKEALLEKGVSFEEVDAMPNQEPAFLAKSPMGKVPALETEHGFLCETNVILDYLEDAHPTPALFPQDAFARARAKQIIKTVELYIEAPAHELLGVFFGQPVSDLERDKARAMMQRGIAAFRQLAKLSPWVAGEHFGYADIFVYRSIGLAASVAEKVHDWNLIAEVPGLAEWQSRMQQRPLTQRLDGESQAVLDAFMKQYAAAK